MDAPISDFPSRNTVVVLAGATSVGKSAVSMELCQRFNSEIIIADSVQIYRGLDIGANKPSLSEQRLVPHHLIDIAEPHETWNTADFCYKALEAIDDILSRGKTPIIVGGSTMWIQWLVYGIPDAPKASENSINRAKELLDALEKKGDEESWGQALEILRSYDPVRSEKIFRNDWYRLRRYLEVSLDLSTADLPEKESLSGERKVLLPREKYDLRCFFLIEDRDELYSIIDERCEQMIEAGLFSETVDLVMNDRLAPSFAVAKSIGYRQVIEYFAADRPPLSPVPTDATVRPDPRLLDLFLDFLRKFSTATRNYAQRQIKWYRKDSHFLFLKISRNLQERSSFATSYRQVTEELMTLLLMPVEDFRRLLDGQVLRSRYLQKLRKKPQVRLPYSCENQVEFDLLLSLIGSGKLSTVSSREESLSSPPSLVVTADLVSSLSSRGKESLPAGEKLTALEDDIRFPENKHMRFFASKFQGLTADDLREHSLYSRVISESEEMRRRLWSEKGREMELFREILLS